MCFKNLNKNGVYDMKHIFVVLLSLFVLIGCSQENSGKEAVEENTLPVETEIKEVEEVEPESEATVENESTVESDAKGENKEEASDTSGVNNDHLRDLAEYEVLAEELDLEHYEGIIKTDNRGNRVILYQTKDRKKEYKSIYIKHKDRLKIVDFNNEDRLLYNGIIHS